MKPHSLTTVVCFLWLIGVPAGLGLADQQARPLPDGFVDVQRVIPDIVVDLKYYTQHNFVGQRIDGYLQPRCILTQAAAAALARVQEQLRPFGLGLKIFDAYRPQRAVDHFVRWAEDVADTRTKAAFYPDIAKNTLIRDGYIASRSSHSRGSTVDLTIVCLQKDTAGQELDMGTAFDFFGPSSWPHFAGLPAVQRANRMLLSVLMQQQGFKPYREEWWHFTLQNEPFAETYFDFPVQ